MKLPDEIEVTDAKYLHGYHLLIGFSNGAVRDVDFEDYLMGTDRGFYNRYRDLKNFRKFKIKNGNVVWGKNWDLIFTLESLYKGKL
ncbi:MAG: DUF2442 domain-containing protein [Flavobacteriales bacterium]